MASLCREFGISRVTGYKIYAGIPAVLLTFPRLSYQRYESPGLI